MATKLIYYKLYRLVRTDPPAMCKYSPEHIDIMTYRRPLRRLWRKQIMLICIRCSFVMLDPCGKARGKPRRRPSGDTAFLCILTFIVIVAMLSIWLY